MNKLNKAPPMSINDQNSWPAVEIKSQHVHFLTQNKKKLEKTLSQTSVSWFSINIRLQKYFILLPRSILTIKLRLQSERLSTITSVKVYCWFSKMIWQSQLLLDELVMKEEANFPTICNLMGEKLTLQFKEQIYRKVKSISAKKTWTVCKTGRL